MKVSASVLVVLVLGSFTAAAADAADARPGTHERRHGAPEGATGQPPGRNTSATRVWHPRQGQPPTHGPFHHVPAQVGAPVPGGGKGAASLNGTEMAARIGRDLNGTHLGVHMPSLNGTKIGVRH